VVFFSLQTLVFFSLQWDVQSLSQKGLNKDEAPSTARKELPVVWPLKGFYTFSLHVKGEKYGEEREEKAKGILCNIREALHNLLATACMQIY
jgi:hypothetical protein